MKRFSQGELARRVGVSQPTISDWENCKTEPSVDNMRTVAQELDVYFEWIATGRGPRDFLPGVQTPQSEYRVQPALPEDEQQLQAMYRKLSPGRRQALLEFLKRWR